MIKISVGSFELYQRFCLLQLLTHFQFAIFCFLRDKYDLSDLSPPEQGPTLTESHLVSPCGTRCTLKFACSCCATTLLALCDRSLLGATQVLHIILNRPGNRGNGAGHVPHSTDLRKCGTKPLLVPGWITGHRVGSSSRSHSVKNNIMVKVLFKMLTK